MRKETLISLGISFLLVMCSSIPKKTNDECLNKQFNFILENNLYTVTHTKEELLIIVKFIDIQRGFFKAAILDKQTFPEYLTGVRDKAKGYFYYQGLTVLIYGAPPNELELMPIREDMKFMIPFEPKLPKAGMPPPPPPLIEPSIYSFKRGKNCYILLQKTIADKLLE